MGLLVYQPFKRVSALHYGVVYFLVIVGMKLLMNLMSGVTEVRGGVVLVHDGRWTLAGAEDKDPCRRNRGTSFDNRYGHSSGLASRRRYISPCLPGTWS